MKILVFAPHAEIWVHAFPEALAVEALRQDGHEIVYLACGRALADYCVPMDMHRLTADSDAASKAAVCASCTENTEILRSSFGFGGATIAAQLTAEERAAAGAALAAVTRDNFLAFEQEGLPLGRYALYEFILRHKLQELELDDRLWREYRALLRGCLHAFYACRRVLEEQRPDRILAYNAVYSVNRTACMLAEQRGVASYYVHAGGNIAHRLQKLMIGRGQQMRFYEDAIERWPAFRGRPCPPALMAHITDHILELLDASSGFVYSSRKQAGTDVRAALGIPAGAKVVAAAMSSPDEMLAAVSVGAKKLPADLPFASQLEWIRALVEYVSRRPDLHLVIRVHPREFPNRRDGVKSQHARLLEEGFRSLPPNAHVNWPDQNLSLYALAEEADVFLNVHSSAGKEMGVLGRPVVIYAPGLVNYPPGLNYVGATREQYFAQIERALADGWSADHIREAYRWLAVEYGYGLVDISDGYAEREVGRASLPRRVINRALRAVDPKYKLKRDCRRRAPRLAEANLIRDVVIGSRASVLEAGDPARFGTATEAEEAEGLRRELRRIIRALYGEGAAAPRGSLHDRLHRFAHGMFP